MPPESIRYKQRFQNYEKALTQLEKFVLKPDLNELEEQGLVKAFEYTFELAWNLLKDFYEYQGSAGIQGSRDAIQLGVSRGLIEDGVTWMEMLQARNLTSHIYNEEKLHEISSDIKSKYLREFDLLRTKFRVL